MASYISKNLTNNEHIVKIAQISWWSQWRMILLGLITLIVGIGLIFLFIAAFRIKTTEMVITNKRVIAKTGFIGRDVTEIRLKKIEGLIVNQSTTEHIFSYGTVLVCGTGDIRMPMAFIKKPAAFSVAINELLEEPVDTLD